MRHRHVPRTWSGREALAQHLHALADAILNVYRVELAVDLLLRDLGHDAFASSPRVTPPPAPANITRF